MTTKTEYKKIKREPVTVRMNVEVAALARDCAKQEYGSTEKLGTWLEDAIHAYAARTMDENRVTALLKILEESLFNRIAAEVEGMHKAFTKRDNALENRVSKLLAVGSYQSCLVSMMMQDAHYSASEQKKAKHDQLRSAAATLMKENLFSEDFEALEIGRRLKRILKANNLNPDRETIFGGLSVICDSILANNPERMQKFKERGAKVLEVQGEHV